MTPSRARTVRPQLTSEELQQLRWCLGGLLTLLALWAVAFMEVDAWGLMALTGVTTAATLAWPSLPARVPRLVHVLAFPFIAAFFALDLWLRSELLPAMVRLDLLLLLYRVLTYRQRRDDLQVIVLGLFLVVVAGVLTVSLGFAAQILVYTACALTFLFVITIGEAARGRNPAASAPAGAVKAAAADEPAPADAAAVPAWAAHVDWRRLLSRVWTVLDWRVAALGGGLFAGLIVVSALLFLLIPRFQLDNGMFLDRFITKKARTGFSDSIRFGDVTEIQQDTSVALHVDVSDPAKIPASPYWRMLVLNEYVDGVFRLSPGLRNLRFERGRTGVAIQGRTRPGQDPTVWTFYLESGVSRHLPLLGAFARLRFGESQTFQYARSLALVALAKEPVTMTAYQVDAFELDGRLHDAPGEFYSGGLRRTRASGDGNALARDEATLRRLLAEAAGGGTPGASEFAARVCGWLRRRHAYSLSPVIPAGPGDPLVRWVDSHEAGHCELFAGSFVLLARVAGYPARIVTGFRGGTWNAYSSSFTVRNSDAHAWAEIFDRASASWLRADPLELSASEGGPDAAGRAALALRTDRSWSARLDSLRVFWYRRIVSFDQQAQANTFKAAKEAMQVSAYRLRERLGRVAVAVRAWWRTPWDAGRIGRMMVLMVIAAALTWGWRRIRLWLPRIPGWRRRRGDPVRREAGRWLRRLAAAGAATTPTAAAPVVCELQRLRFGARNTWSDPASVFRGASRELGRLRRDPRITTS